MKRLMIILSIIVVAIFIISFAIFIKMEAEQEKLIRSQTFTVPVATNPLNADTIFNLVNAERTKNGLKPLIRDARLDATAQARSDDMVARNYFSHFDPVTGKNLVNILNEQKQCMGASENIINSSTETGAITWWMNSKPHREAILDIRYDLAGMAINGNIGVMHFCNLK